MIEIEKAPVQTPEWVTNWETNDVMICGWYGVEQKIDGKGKHYRAFCRVARNDRSERLESAVFASRDDADIPQNHRWTSVPGSEIEQQMKKAYEARSVMLPTEASPNDMRAKAHDLRKEAADLFNGWLRQEELERQAVKDGQFFFQIKRAVETASPEERLSLAKLLLGDSEASKPEKAEPTLRRSRKDHI